MGKCNFQEDWLQKKDVNGHPVKNWANKNTDSEANCFVCKKSFSIEKGFDRFNQHASGTKHKENYQTHYAPHQLRLGIPSASREQASENVTENTVDNCEY